MKSRPHLSFVLAAALALPTRAQTATHRPPDPAFQILALANADRATHALAPLAWDSALARAAMLHARSLAAYPALLHQLPGEPDLLHRAAFSGAHLTAIAENLLRGSNPTPAEIEQTWLSTPVHRANLLNPELNAAGIAVLRTPAGVLVVEDLARTTPTPDFIATEQAVAQALLAAGVPRAHPTLAARALCLQPPAPGVATPYLTITWDGPATTQSPTQLPPALLHQLALHPSPEAEIAACPGAATAEGFNTTRVTALLH